jgi:ribosomal protein S21
MAKTIVHENESIDDALRRFQAFRFKKWYLTRIPQARILRKTKCS